MKEESRAPGGKRRDPASFPPLRAAWCARIDTDASSKTEGDLLTVLIEARPFKTAEACRAALLDRYRPVFPNVDVQVEPEPVLVSVPLGPGLYLTSSANGRP